MQGFLGAALFVEGLLFAFHLKGTALDWRLHFLLVMVVRAGLSLVMLSVPLLPSATSQLHFCAVVLSRRTISRQDSCAHGRQPACRLSPGTKRLHAWGCKWGPSWTWLV